jgi:hypothetical protein
LYKRSCHNASNLVHVCDVFDALRTNRPYREAWPTERALTIIEEGAGPEFDADIARAFIQMMRRWEGRLAEVSMEAPELQIAGPVAVPALNGEAPPASEDGAPAVEGATPSDTTF